MGSVTHITPNDYAQTGRWVEGATASDAEASSTVALTITTASPLPGGTGGVAYDEALTSSGGDGTVVFVHISGTMPPHEVALHPYDGHIKGTPDP